MKTKSSARWILPLLVLSLMIGCLGKMRRDNPFDPAGTGAGPEGLVFAWLFEDGFKELKGRNNFTNNTAVFTEPGNRGRSLKMSDYAAIALSTEPFAPSPSIGFTVEFWVLIREKKEPLATPAPNTYYRIVGSRNGIGAEGWWFDYGDASNGGPVTIRFNVDGGSGLASAVAPMGPVPTGWFHVAGVYQPDLAPNATAQLYINGSFIFGAPHIRDTFDALNPVEVGDAQLGTSGKIELDTLQLWDFKMTAAQVNKVKVGELP